MMIRIKRYWREKYENGQISFPRKTYNLNSQRGIKLAKNVTKILTIVVVAVILQHGSLFFGC